jgi:hypothetical protein
MSLLDSSFSTTVVVSHRRAVDLGATNRMQNGDVIRAIARHLDNPVGSVDAAVVVANSSGMPSPAGATALLSTASGTVGVTVNGVGVTVTASGGDAATAGLLVTAVNTSTNALVNGFVRATQTRARLTLSATAAGSYVEIRDVLNNTAYRITATAAATGVLGEFSIAGDDTADALALANAINQFPGLNQLVRAEGASAVCQVYFLDNSTARVAFLANGITVTSGGETAAAVHVFGLVPGAISNAITFAVTGTGLSAQGSAARLFGGVGGIVGTRKACVGVR